MALSLAAGSVQAQQRPPRGATPPPAQPAPAPPAATPTASAELPAPTPPDAEELGCRVLTGRVTDQLNHPLTGATVLVRTRTTRGFNIEPSITNSEGQYMLSAKQPIPRNAVLEISAGGYTTFAQPLANCQPVDASLEPLPGTRFKNDGRIKKTSASGKIH
ncbi:carboxypeptidase-like regulatory domain-containing protein [Hymenobacter ruricola]|uniref:Carboxypeptidase regulatory-like domain-containing protein n=1 Tax=Hymenobacter ruricola TaxID=2791023 RepID=A0ABS0I3B1_9BACT|nr:carboxypeptidase-like regulatory domain-containing protein [Hymenobacter ruricola]MBF9221439.1 carboxypeptidase regulatory-like domain-containing protein [Hymenobacter ruricola]